MEIKELNLEDIKLGHIVTLAMDYITCKHIHALLINKEFII